MNIRPAREGDIPALIGLLEQVLNIHHEGRPDIFRGHTKKYNEDELRKILQNENTPVFVADGGEVLGYAFCILQEKKNDSLFQDRKNLYIDDLCVDEGCRSQGIGKALFAYVKDYADSIGCHSVTLNVWAFNESALKFYASCGMEPQRIVMELKTAGDDARIVPLKLT